MKKASRSYILWIPIVLVWAFQSWSLGAESPGSSSAQIRQVFPSGLYKLIGKGTERDHCPLSGRFLWHSQNDGAWALRMGPRTSLHLPKGALSTSKAQANPYNSPMSICQNYKVFSFKSRSQSLSIVDDYRCSQRQLNKRYSFQMQRHADRITIVRKQLLGLEIGSQKEKQISRCSYRLSP